ncbi:MAG: hypothetical protein EXS09_17450 [Gemmataceae bacterium]|nr:hypothetical protein [Gemmataceae bacterium]
MAEEALDFIALAKSMVEQGRHADALKSLKAFGSLTLTSMPELIRDAQADLACVADRIVWQFPNGPESFVSAHEAWACLCSIVATFVYNEPEPLECFDFLERFSVNTSAIRVGLVRERARLVERAAMKTPESGGQSMPTKRKGRPPMAESSNDVLIASAFVLHHGYDNRSVSNYEPAKLADIANRASSSVKKVNSMAVSRFLTRHFGAAPYKKYEAACRGKRIERQLLHWSGEISKSYSQGYDDTRPARDGRNDKD